MALAYSSLEQFLEGCGADQPWIVFPADQLEGILSQAATAAEAGGVSLLMDVPMPSDLRGTAGSMAEDEPDWTDAESEDWPAVWLASQPYARGQERVDLELQPMPSDRLAVMAYTSTAAVEAGAGPHQAAFPVPAGLVGEARRQAGADTICLDTPLPEALRHGTDEGRST